MNVPADLAALLQHRRLEPIRTGESGAHVWKCVADASAWYLKAAPLSARVGLGDEAERLRWMGDRGFPVPKVRSYIVADEHEYLLTDEAIGEPASSPAWEDRTADVAAALGRFLAELHRAETSDCPFDRRVRVQLDEARRRVASGDVDEDDFDAGRRGRSAASLLAELLTQVPPMEDLVLVHGDFCLPNVLLSIDAAGIVRVTGVIDVGRAGVGDRHQDLALGVRSLADNADPTAVARFLAAYDGASPDPQRMEFFTVLDEFF